MSKIVFKSLRKNIKIIIAFLLFFCFNSISAQNKFTISYNEKLALKNVSSDSRFDIIGSGTTVRLQGKEINEYVFTKPGNYKVKVTEAAAHATQDCNHNHFPKEMAIVVGRTKMTFDATKLLFSAPIRKNQDTKGITVSIPVQIETFDHKPVRLSSAPVLTAGIGTSIMATLNSAVEVPEGTTTLTYSLTGIATENAYLMFDFIDSNGNVQSVSLTRPVQN